MVGSPGLRVCEKKQPSPNQSAHSTPARVDYVKIIMQLITPAACLANRGLVRFAMQRFRGAAEDLGGASLRSFKAHTIGGANASDSGVVPTAAGTSGSGMTALAGGALDTLDCEIGRALADGRLDNRASREVT